MNYIKQINAFWELERERGDFTAYLQSFYFALLYFANRFGKDEFSLYREDMMVQAKLSKNLYYTVRTQAKDVGIIDFREGANARSKCTFIVLPVSSLLSQIKDTRRDTTEDTTSDTSEDTTSDHTHKTTKLTKELNLQTTKEQRKETPPEGDGFPERSDLRWDQDLIYLPGQQKEEKEKDSAQKEKEDEPLSKRHWESKFKDAWWQFYKDQNQGEEPPYSMRNPQLFSPIKKIQQDLAAVFNNDDEKAFQEFVYILASWPTLKDYHRHRLLPDQIHKSLVEIRRYLRENTAKPADNTAHIPVLGEALEIFREAHLQLRQLPANVDTRRDLPLLGQTLEYLKGLKAENTWEDTLQMFELICRKWPELEKADKFYEKCFTIKYIHGNTSNIITAIQAKRKRQPEFTDASVAAWLAANGAVRQ